MKISPKTGFYALMAILRPSDKSLRGIVLAGGQSKRFGSDKALAQWGGVSFLEKTLETLRSFDKEPVIITRPGANYDFKACRVEKDLIPGLGPLGGLDTAFHLFRESILLVLTCDMPLVSAKTLHRLLSEYDPRVESMHFRGADGQIQPFPGLYDAFLLRDRARKSLRSKQYSVRTFIHSSGRIKILCGEYFRKELVNMNYQHDVNQSIQ